MEKVKLVEQYARGRRRFEGCLFEDQVINELICDPDIEEKAFHPDLKDQNRNLVFENCAFKSVMFNEKVDLNRAEFEMCKFSRAAFNNLNVRNGGIHFKLCKFYLTSFEIDSNIKFFICEFERSFMNNLGNTKDLILSGCVMTNVEFVKTYVDESCALHRSFFEYCEFEDSNVLEHSMKNPEDRNEIEQ